MRGGFFLPWGVEGEGVGFVGLQIRDEFGDASLPWGFGSRLELARLWWGWRGYAIWGMVTV